MASILHASLKSAQETAAKPQASWWPLSAVGRLYNKLKIVAYGRKQKG